VGILPVDHRLLNHVLACDIGSVTLTCVHLHMKRILDCQQFDLTKGEGEDKMRKRLGSQMCGQLIKNMEDLVTEWLFLTPIKPYELKHRAVHLVERQTHFPYSEISGAMAMMSNFLCPVLFIRSIDAARHFGITVKKGEREEKKRQTLQLVQREMTPTLGITYHAADACLLYLYYLDKK
jgi:hypothetical protein